MEASPFAQVRVQRSSSQVSHDSHPRKMRVLRLLTSFSLDRGNPEKQLEGSSGFCSCVISSARCKRKASPTPPHLHDFTHILLAVGTSRYPEYVLGEEGEAKTDDSTSPPPHHSGWVYSCPRRRPIDISPTAPDLNPDCREERTALALRSCGASDE
jgi:hypothetical protein